MSPEPKWPWSILGLDKMPEDVKDIRRAYARTLKQIDQANDIKGFSDLRAAYEYAVAVREGRNQRNDLNRSRKAEAKAMTAENIRPAPAIDPLLDDSLPLDTAPNRSIAPPARVTFDPPALTAEQQAQADHKKAIDALLHFVSTDSIVVSGGLRINQVLDNPLSQDPDHATAFRYAIAEVIRTRFRRNDGIGVLSPQIDKETLLRLDKTYGWLTDYGAFRRDFWNDNNLLDAMATRAYGSIKAPKHPPPRPKTRAGRVWLWGKDHATMLTLCYIGFIVAASAAANDGPSGAVIFNILKWMILVPIILAMLAVGFIVCRAVFFLARGLWRNLSDAAVRFKLRFGPKK